MAAARLREQALLAQASVLRDKHEALAAASGQSFNLFAILDRETDEVRTHSAMLAELLNPNGSHRQGPVFARLFAERFRIDADGIESARVWREETVAEGSRADILMQLGDTCIVIENKIYANDQPRQLQRYQAYAAQSPNRPIGKCSTCRYTATNQVTTRSETCRSMTWCAFPTTRMCSPGLTTASSK